ncbi:MAG: ABC transporter ATP-binding protein [Planctomycetota bacterium]
MIEVECLSKIFSSGYALREVSLSVSPGEVCGLIGPNGAGKTTLLRILATVLKPSGGSVKLAGFELAVEVMEARRRIGYMPDTFSTYEELRVDSFLEFFAHLYGLPRDRVRPTVTDILTLVDLLAMRHAPIERLSLGVRQRLSLARALLHNPDVLLLDEPISGLDPRARVEMRALLRELRSMGKTILISSHVLTDLADLCDRFLVLERGEVTFTGTLEELTRRVFRGRRIEIAVAGRGEEAAGLIRRRMWAQEVRSLGPDAFEVELTSADVSPEEVSATLFEAGFQVTRFAEREVDLEEAFLRLTQGIVS